MYGFSLVFSNFIHSLFLKVDPLGAQQKVLEIANSLGLNVSVAVAHEVSVTNIVGI